MQIQYCDDCGTRIDDTEVVAVDGHCYCAQCARNHAPVARAGAAAVLARAPRPSGRLRSTRNAGTPDVAASAPGRAAAGALHPDTDDYAQDDSAGYDDASA